MWLGIFGVAIALGIGRLASSDASAATRYAATALQLLGLATVAMGLSQMRSLFGKPTFFSAVLNWLRRLVAVFMPAKVAIGAGSISATASMTGEARATLGVPPNATLEQRMSILEQNLERLRNEVDSRLQRVNRDIGSVRESVERESLARQEADRHASRIIEEVAVGGLHLETVGLMWLLLGTLGTSVPDEIAAAWRWLVS